jgi:hypothetical protein
LGNIYDRSRETNRASFDATPGQASIAFPVAAFAVNVPFIPLLYGPGIGSITGILDLPVYPTAG